MQRLFDPEMFNFTWESINHDEYVVGTYYIEDVKEPGEWIEHLKQVERLALEGSTSSWVRVKDDTDAVRERLCSKVLGYYEIPTDQKNKKAAVIQLGFPIRSVGR